MTFLNPSITMKIRATFIPYLPCIAISAMLFLSACPSAWGRIWTDTSGKTIEAEIVSADSKEVVVKKAGKEFTIPLSRLSDEDGKYVEEWLAEEKSREAEENIGKPKVGDTETFDGKPLVRGGKVNLYEYPYSEENLADLKKYDKKDTGFRIGIAVPADFDPSKPQKLFVVSAPGNNDQQKRSGNTGALGTYAKACTDAGWVCLAWDTNIGRSKHDGDMLYSLRLLSKVWPEMKSWQFAVGGFSGGAKASFGVCAFLIRHDFDMVGVFLTGCNEDRSEGARKFYSAKASAYRKLRVFLSTGDADSYVNEGQLTAVIKSLKSNGMRTIRSERFKGGHTIYQPHIGDAVKWFEEKD